MARSTVCMRAALLTAHVCLRPGGCPATVPASVCPEATPRRPAGRAVWQAPASTTGPQQPGRVAHRHGMRLTVATAPGTRLTTGQRVTTNRPGRQRYPCRVGLARDDHPRRAG
jgi:hypothetical protein